MYYVRLDTMQILTRSQLDQLFPLTGFPPDADMTLAALTDLEPAITILIEGVRPEVTYPDTVAPGELTLREDGYVERSWIVVPASNEQWVAISTEELNRRLRQANAQVTALQGRVTTLDYVINGQDPEDPDYTEPTTAEIAELPVRKAQLKSWNSYNVKLGRVSTVAGWPQTPAWPVMPEPYTNETSAVAAPVA